MIHLGVQYYRPPFHNPRYWEGDMAQIADSGLNTIQRIPLERTEWGISVLI